MFSKLRTWSGDIAFGFREIDRAWKGFCKKDLQAKNNNRSLLFPSKIAL